MGKIMIHIDHGSIVIVSPTRQTLRDRLTGRIRVSHHHASHLWHLLGVTLDHLDHHNPPQETS